MKINSLDKCLRDLVKGLELFEYPYEKVWNVNGISLQRRLEKDRKLRTRVNLALSDENLKKYIVDADITAPTRCIDGRPLKKTRQEGSFALGPKVAGGTAHAALTHRIVDTDSIKNKLVFEEDIKYVIRRYKSIGIGFGGHIDDHAKGANTGCGAVDNINLILEKMQRPEPQEQLRGIAKIILGKGYEGAHLVSEVIGRMLYLDALKPIYMPKAGNNPKGEFLYKKIIAKTIRSESKEKKESVPALTGPHHEVAVILNYVRGTTFDNDKFSMDNKNEIQVFGWDIWEVYEESVRLYEYKMDDPLSKQLQIIEKRMKFITTRILLGIATTMVLTDGSLKVVTVK